MTEKWERRDAKRFKLRYGMVVDGRSTRDLLAPLARKGPVKRRKRQGKK